MRGSGKTVGREKPQLERSKLMAGSRRCVSARQLGLLLWKNSILKRRSHLGKSVPVSLSQSAKISVCTTNKKLESLCVCAGLFGH